MLMLAKVFAMVIASAFAGDGFVLNLAVMNMPIEKVRADVELAAKIGARHFNIPVLLCQKTAKSNELNWCDPNPENYKQRVVELTRELNAKGYTTGYLPFQLAEDGAWRGHFDPDNFDAWGASYLRFLDEIAEMGVQAGIKDFITGTELTRLYMSPIAVEQKKRADYWRMVYARMKAKLGKGVMVVLVANWDQYDDLPFWDASDAIGLSAYYPLANGRSDTSVSEMTSEWRKWQKKIVKVADRMRKPLYFSEVGYASHADAAKAPWTWEGPIDLELQARLFEAYGNVWAKDAKMRAKLVRFQLWALDVPEDPLNDIGFGIFGKPAEKVLEAIFTTRLQRSAPGTEPSSGRRGD